MHDKRKLGAIAVLIIFPTSFLVFSAAEAIHGVNSVVGEEGSSPAALLESLANEHVGVVNVQEAQALQYLNLLKTMKAAKAEVHY